MQVSFSTQSQNLIGCWQIMDAQTQTSSVGQLQVMRQLTNKTKQELAKTIQSICLDLQSVDNSLIMFSIHQFLQNQWNQVYQLGEDDENQSVAFVRSKTTSKKEKVQKKKVEHRKKQKNKHFYESNPKSQIQKKLSKSRERNSKYKTKMTLKNSDNVLFKVYLNPVGPTKKRLPYQSYYLGLRKLRNESKGGPVQLEKPKNKLRRATSNNRRNG